MSNRHYTAAKAKLAGEVVRADLSFRALDLLWQLQQRELVVRTAQQKHFWVDKEIATQLHVDEPPSATMLVDGQARSQQPAKLWIPTGSLLASLVEKDSVDTLWLSLRDYSQQPLQLSFSDLEISDV